MVKKLVEEKGKRLMPFIALFAVIGLGVGQLVKTGSAPSEVYRILGGLAVGFPIKKIYDGMNKDPQ